MSPATPTHRTIPSRQPHPHPYPVPPPPPQPPAGLGAGIVGTSISNGLIALRKKLNPDFTTPVGRPACSFFDCSRVLPQHAHDYVLPLSAPTPATWSFEPLPQLSGFAWRQCCALGNTLLH